MNTQNDEHPQQPSTAYINMGNDGAVPVGHQQQDPPTSSYSSENTEPTTTIGVQQDQNQEINKYRGAYQPQPAQPTAQKQLDFRAPNKHDNFNHLTSAEISRLKDILHSNDIQSLATVSLDSDYPEFGESTHAWAIFADDPKKRASFGDRLVGIIIILFQLFTYWMFAKEAIEDYQDGQVPVLTSFDNCVSSGEAPQDNFMCEAEVTNNFDAFVAYSMLGIFLSGDFLQSYRTFANAQSITQRLFAAFAAIEVVGAYVGACIAIGYQLYIGEATDAVEVGVGLLFIRELSQRAYTGIRQGGKQKQYLFFSVLFVLVVTGMLLDPLGEYLFAAK